MVQANPAVLATGARPSAQLYTENAGEFTPAGTGSQYNVLMIMVDQMRKPSRWLPTGSSSESAFLQNYMPNTYKYIYQNAMVFSNYYTAATNCTPARATLLTGLYTQQNCMFLADSHGSDPTLNTGFPTFGSALTNVSSWGGVSASYDCAWVGKWHLSALSSAATCSLGAYGFAHSESLPSDTGNPSFHLLAGNIPSPIGWANEGNTGSVTNMSTSDYYASDYDIFYWLDHVWLPHRQGLSSPGPWFCAVSFVNPHDIASFPGFYAFSATSSPCISGTPPGSCASTCAFVRGSVSFSGPQYSAPATSGYNGTPSIPQYYPAYPTTLPYTTVPSPWNGADLLTSYATTLTGGTGTPGKPDFQATFLSGLQQMNGGVVPYCSGSALWKQGWTTFLNYYVWMQTCVDSIIGMIFGQNLQTGDVDVWDAPVNPAVPTGPSMSNNTMIIFLADHGEYGGSHTLENKGGAAYDESINVPLYILYPGQTQKYTFSQMVSSVDVMPFLLTTASLSESWQSSGPYSYLPTSRELIHDIIFSSRYVPKRVVSINDVAGNPTTVPFILHTYDEAQASEMGGGTLYASMNPVPKSHVLCMRTGSAVSSAGQTISGKFVKYDTWPCGQTTPPIQSKMYQSQFEFYNYGTYSSQSGGNTSELGNEIYLSGLEPGIPSSGPLVNDATMGVNFWNAMNTSAVLSELTPIPSLSTPHTSAFNAYEGVVCPGD